MIVPWYHTGGTTATVHFRTKKQNKAGPPLRDRLGREIGVRGWYATFLCVDSLFLRSIVSCFLAEPASLTPLPTLCRASVMEVVKLRIVYLRS